MMYHLKQYVWKNTFLLRYILQVSKRWISFAFWIAREAASNAYVFEIERITITCGWSQRRKWSIKGCPSTHITHGITTVVMLTNKIQRAIITTDVHCDAWDFNPMGLRYSHCRLDEVVAGFFSVSEIDHCKWCKLCRPATKWGRNLLTRYGMAWIDSQQQRQLSCSILPWKLHSHHVERAVVDLNRWGVLEGDPWRLKHFRCLFNGATLDLNSPLHEAITERGPLSSTELKK